MNKYTNKSYIIILLCCYILFDHSLLAYGKDKLMSAKDLMELSDDYASQAIGKRPSELICPKTFDCRLRGPWIFPSPKNLQENPELKKYFTTQNFAVYIMKDENMEFLDVFILFLKTDSNNLSEGSILEAEPKIFLKSEDFSKLNVPLHIKYFADLRHFEGAFWSVAGGKTVNKSAALNILKDAGLLPHRVTHRDDKEIVQYFSPPHGKESLMFQLGFGFLSDAVQLVELVISDGEVLEVWIKSTGWGDEQLLHRQILEFQETGEN